jgi:hypothetical protein
VRLCLSDNDWVVKLAAFDLLSHALKRLKVKKENVRVLGTCRAVVCGKRLREKYGTSMVNAAEAFLDGVQILEDEAIDDAEFIRLTNERMDGGEAQLFASEFPGICIIATDDKRAMMKLAEAPGLSDNRQKRR